MAEVGIPYLNFSDGALDLENESEAWRVLSDKVREACESHGCFLVKYSDIPMKLLENMFMGLESLFDLPQEIKDKYADPNQYDKYLSSSFNPLHESFRIDCAPRLEEARAFTNIMWPHENPSFCEVLNSTSSKMLNLSLIIMKMILESFCIGRYYQFMVENSSNSFRILKHKVPPSNDSAGMSLLPHTDKNFSTILSENEVQGVEVLSKEVNKWIQVKIPTGSFMVFVGDTFKAWSNGRLHAAKHKVIMKGDKFRYSCALFLLPKEGATIEVPQELIDKDHPLRYRPFTYSDFVSFYTANYGDQTLEIFAGL
ncbi:putative 2-oxoglutarate-dependent dioxygenase AOP1.2 [Camellia lanceoleosa]|uniref:2-oxoglutarate-dependent dioxygenase AOP1.2 n=1 Tax=Camellia lanceoleosa TaxID=1840588 RepID=A0ACC0FEZ6_9ERIC|nr:putative 2-oxoglutarate-dependent dioxygenase AOP1.2 [Camellia lanceoleosa]